MRASSGASSASFLPGLTTSDSPPTSAAPEPDDDQPQNFSDLLDQQGANSPAAPKPKPADVASDGPAATSPSLAAPVTRSMTIVPSATLAPAVPSSIQAVSSDTSPRTFAKMPVSGGKTAATGANASTQPNLSLNLALGSAISSPRYATTAKGSSRPSQTGTASAPTAAGTAGTPLISAGSDLTTMMVQAMLQTSPSAGSSGTIASNPASAPGTTTPAETYDLTGASAAAAMSTTLSAAGTESPLSASARSSSPNGTKEKKSSAEAAEGTFLQSGSGTSATTSASSNLTATAVTGPTNASGNQQVATSSSPGRHASGGVATTAANIVGTAHDENKTTMTSDLTMPAQMTGASANAANTSPDVHILLSSNSDFEDALTQVIHIAQLNDAAGSTNPTRIAIELQTPPGAIVNVYVSKQDDSTYRAQLSASDPAALSWVQDKISELRQNNDLGVQVKWLPAQIESNSSLSATTTSSDGSNLNWNRDGQNQNDNSPDDRSQSQRQDHDAYEDLTEAEAEAFAANFAAVGGVA